jgi:HEAT repeat protein
LVALGKRETPNGRKMALYCIRDIELSSAEVDVVVSDCSASPDLHVRLAALAALTQMVDSEKAGQIAMTMLADDPEPGVRRAAASALGRLGNRGEHVRRLLTDASLQEADPSLRKAATQALRQIGQQ